MVIKRRLVAHGNVQEFGYRTYVKVIARRLRVKGSVRNPRDGTVENYCKCPPDTYRRFLEAINVKTVDPKAPLQMDVERIEEHPPDERVFDDSMIKEPFEVEYNGIK